MNSFWHISLCGTLIVRWRLKVYSMLPHRVLKTKALAKYALQQESKYFTSLFFILLYSTRHLVGSSKKKKQKLRKELLLFLLLSFFFVARSLNELVAALWQQNTKTKCFFSSHLPFWPTKIIWCLCVLSLLFLLSFSCLFPHKIVCVVTYVRWVYSSSIWYWIYFAKFRFFPLYDIHLKNKNWYLTWLWQFVRRNALKEDIIWGRR